MTIDGRRLTYFVTIAELGSLGRAAEALHVAQPALSRQLRLLEEQVGVALMTRHTRGVQLTPAGQAYLHSARKLLQDDAAARLQARRAARGEAGHLRLGISEIYAWHADLLGALHNYRAQSPEVTFTIEAMLSGAVVERVLDRRLDLALAYPGVAADDELLATQPWIEDDYVLAVHESSPWASRAPRRLAELKDEDFVLFRRDQSAPLHDWIIHHFHQRGLSPRIVQEGTSHFTVLGLVAAGLGCTIIPASAEHHLPPGVRLLPVPDLELRVPIHLVRRRDNPSPLIDRFIALLAGPGARGAKPRRRRRA